MKKYSEERRENSRVERLQKNARFGEIVFTKHGVYEALPCDQCGKHHKVLYPPELMNCEEMSNQCNNEHLDNTGEPKAFMDCHSEATSPRLSRTSLRSSKKASTSIFRGTDSAKHYLSGVRCSNMGFLHGQAENSQHFPKRSQTYPKYSKYKISEDFPLSYSNVSLDNTETMQNNGCEICLLAEESKLYHVDCRNGKTDGKVGNKGIGGYVQGTVCCPNCSQMMCFQAQNEEDLERQVKKEMLIQDEDVLRQRLCEDRDHYRLTLQKLKSAEQGFEKVIADVAEVVTGELKNIDKATRKKRRSKQLRKRHLGSEATTNQERLSVKPPTDLHSVSSEESTGPQHVGGTGQMVRQNSLSGYLRQLYRSHSDTGLKTGPRNEQCSLSDIMIEVPDEKSGNVSPAKHEQNKARGGRQRKSGLYHLHALGERTISTGGGERPYVTVIPQDAVTREECSTPKLQPCLSVSSAMRKLTGTESNPSVKKISFAQYSEGEKIKPISSDDSLKHKTSMARFSETDNDDASIPSRKPSSIIEHVDSLILLESSMSLRSGNELSKFSSQENISRDHHERTEDTEENSKSMPHTHFEQPRIEEKQNQEGGSSLKANNTGGKRSETVGLIEEGENQEKVHKLSKKQPKNFLDPTNNLDSIHLKCMSSTENLEIKVVNDAGSKQRKKSKVERTTESEEGGRTHKIKMKSSTHKCCHENSETSKKCCHHYKRSQSGNAPETRRKKNNCGKLGSKKATSSAKPPPYGGHQIVHADANHKEQKINSCPPTFRNNKHSYYKQTKSSKQQCMELTAQAKDLLSANQETLDTCVALRDRFGKNYTSLIDCVEAQSKLENQLENSMDSDVNKSHLHVCHSKSRNNRCSSAQDFKTAQRSTNRDSNTKLCTNDDVDCLLDQESDSSVLETRKRPQTSCHISRQKQHPNLLDRIVELHIGQAALTDRSVNSSQHSDSDKSRPVYHKFTSGVVKGKRNRKPDPKGSVNQSKADVKAKREALLQHLLLNEAQQSRNDNSSLSTLDSDTYESLHLLVGKIRQSHRGRKVENDNRMEKFTQLQNEPVRVTKGLPVTRNTQNTNDKPKSLPVIVKTHEDDLCSFVPQGINSNSDSRLPKLGPSGQLGSQQKRRFLAPEELNSRTQIVGPQRSNSSARAGKEVLKEDLEEDKYERKLPLPPGSSRLMDNKRQHSSSALPPISSTPNSKPNVSSRSQAFAETVQERGNRFNKKVTITADDTIHTLEQGEQNENESFLKRIFNSIVSIKKSIE